MKYYTEIENNFFLPVNDFRDMNRELDHSKLPKWFYEKYQNLIDFIPNIKELFAEFSFDPYSSSENYSPYDRAYFERLIQVYKRKYLCIHSHLKEDLPLLEIKNSIQCWGNILDLMFMIDPTLFERDSFISMMQLYNSALIDIGAIDGSLNKKYLSNQWLLTSRGHLYNMQSTAHEAGFFSEYYIEKVQWFLTKREPYIRKNDKNSGKINPCPELSDASIILKREYVTWNALDLLLHYLDYYHFNYKIYDSKIIMISVGMIELRQDLFHFFEQLELYTASPKDSLKKVIQITGNNYIDFLIRCCGVSKITSSPYKTIVTSVLTAKDDFREYLEKGYNVCFIPPILINKQTRTVEELNMDSLVIHRYIENEVIVENNLGGGKVYTNHMKF